MSTRTKGTPPFPRAPIFDLPELQTKRQRLVYSALTLTAWLFWAYLWLPLITAIGWVLGFRAFVREIVLPDPSNLVSTGTVYLIVIAALGATLVAWSRYHVHRFRGKERRSTPPRISDAEMRRWFGVSDETLRQLRRGSSLRVDYDAETGRLLGTAPPTGRSGPGGGESAARGTA
ncbi:MAG: poly-beta-1,6-N-acetyl-D-glucosamine biosynthesis protein PgaD [Gemmatimonadota bacterium]|nr:poly-beta-1,6-N-acetyl-D-glucosamine biosynthesis protein PgaD [Gemmatimonadota bacterium]